MRRKQTTERAMPMNKTIKKEPVKKVTKKEMKEVKKEPKSSSKKKILIVEDEKPIARALELKLTHVGYEAKTAFNGEEALPLIETESFSLILLDLIMPKVDGFKVLEALKEKNNKTPVIVLSNLSQEEDEKRVMGLGAVGFFIKSNSSITDIVQRVQEKLGTP